MNLTVLYVIGAVASLVALGTIIAETVKKFGHRDPGAVITSRKRVGVIGVWRWNFYHESLAYFDEYVARFSVAPADTNTAVASRDDLARFAKAQLLTAAAVIAPFSQGKANLFQYLDDSTTPRKIISERFVGNYPASQVLETFGCAYRPMSVDPAKDRRISTAARAILKGSPVVEPLRYGEYVSSVEKTLGTTHIAAVPTESDDYEALPGGHPAVVAIDLHIPLGLRWLAKPGWPMHRWLIARLRYLGSRLAMVSEMVGACPVADGDGEAAE